MISKGKAIRAIAPLILSSSSREMPHSGACMPASDTSLARSKSACSPDGYLQIMMTMSDVDQPDQRSTTLMMMDNRRSRVSSMLKRGDAESENGTKKGNGSRGRCQNGQETPLIDDHDDVVTD